MIQYVNAFIISCAELDDDEQVLFSTAYLNAARDRRASLRAVSRVEDSAYNDLTRYYRQTLQQDLETVCENALDLLNERLIPAATTTSSKVLYYKL